MTPARRIEKLTGAATATTTESTGKSPPLTAPSIFFGLNRLPGLEGRLHAGDELHLDGAGVRQPGRVSRATTPLSPSAYCSQAWRWQLDYVVDPHNNAMAYYWKTETNNYGRNVSGPPERLPLPLTPGGYLDHIDYGLRNDAVYSGKAMGKVAFAVDERCRRHAAHSTRRMPRTGQTLPFDQYCKDGAECKSQYSPTFWSRKRLTASPPGADRRRLQGRRLLGAGRRTFPHPGTASPPRCGSNPSRRTGKVGGNLTASTGDVRR